VISLKGLIMSRVRVGSFLSGAAILLMTITLSGPAAIAEGDGVPSVRAQTEWNQVWLTDWPAGTEITVVVDTDWSYDVGDSSSYLATMTVTADSAGQATAHFDDEEFQFEPGHYVTALGGVTTKELLVPDLTVYVNDLTGEVFGTSSIPNPDATMSLFAFPASGEVFRHLSVANASWSSNLSTPPVHAYDFGQMSLPLPGGLQGSFMQTDPDDDATEISWYLVWRGIFRDDDDSVFEHHIDWLATTGITRGCNPPINDRFCPHSTVTRGQMAAFLVRALDLENRLDDPFTDDDGSIFETDIERLAAAGITRGCNPPDNDLFCPHMTVTRGQMAAFLVRALGYTDAGFGDLFVDDDGSPFEADIDKLATAGITLGCNPPLNNQFCPTQAVTRSQMAAFLNRALE
jgi:hypothetical protein